MAQDPLLKELVTVMKDVKAEQAKTTAAVNGLRNDVGKIVSELEKHGSYLERDIPHPPGRTNGDV